MPYIWNPTTKRSEWQQYYGGQDYGPKPTITTGPPTQPKDLDPHYGGDPNAPIRTVDPPNPVDWEGNGISINDPRNPGYTGGEFVDPAQVPPTPTPTTTPTTTQTNYSQWGTNRYEGWDPQKIASGQTSPKYLVGRVLSNFDPRQGITPQVLAELNKLGIGTFEGSGQNLRVVNASPEFEGYTDWGDMIHAYQGGAGANAAWQYGINNSRDAAYDAYGAGGGSGSGASGSTSGSSGGSSNNSLFGGNSSSSSETRFMNPGLVEEARAKILELLRSPKLDPNQLRNSPEMQAVQLMAQRAEERDRAALAERAAVGGWSGSGGMEGGLSALREQRGQTEMEFMGQLAVDYMERQREDIKRGIEFAMQDGQFSEAQALQRELAAIEAAIEREKIAASLRMNEDDNALARYQTNQNLLFDYADLDFRKNKDVLDRGVPPEL